MVPVGCKKTLLMIVHMSNKKRKLQGYAQMSLAPRLFKMALCLIYIARVRNL